MPTDCSVDLIFIRLAELSIILFWIKKYSHGKIFLFGLWQMVLILKISYSGKIAPVAGAILPSYIIHFF